MASLSSGAPTGGDDAAKVSQFDHGCADLLAAAFGGRGEWALNTSWNSKMDSG